MRMKVENVYRAVLSAGVQISRCKLSNFTRLCARAHKVTLSEDGSDRDEFFALVVAWCPEESRLLAFCHEVATYIESQENELKKVKP